MVDAVQDDPGDRIVLHLDAGGPVELVGLTESFSALARYYGRYHPSEYEGDLAPKLYITRLQTGSIIAEIAPYAAMLGVTVATAEGPIVVAEFVRRMSKALKAFADMDTPTPPTALPSSDDARDLREFVRPLTAKRGAKLGISHARYTSIGAERQVVVEYTFTEEEINRAALNIDSVIPLGRLADMSVPELLDQRLRKEVMLFFQQASRAPGKEDGRTADKAIVPDVSDKALPTYFRKGVNDLKDQMVRGEQNPLTNAFIVDVHVQILNGEPKGYLVTDVHKVIPLSEGD